jgi:hypothetical protein
MFGLFGSEGLRSGFNCAYPDYRAKEESLSLGNIAREKFRIF